MSDDKKHRLQLRFNEYVQKIVDQACAITGEDFSSFVISAALDKANKTIEQKERIEKYDAFFYTERKPYHNVTKPNTSNETEVQGVHLKNCNGKNLNLATRYFSETNNYSLCVALEEYNCNNLFDFAEEIYLFKRETGIFYLIFENLIDSTFTYVIIDAIDNGCMLYALYSEKWNNDYKAFFYAVETFSKKYMTDAGRKFIGYFLTSKNRFMLDESGNNENMTTAAVGVPKMYLEKCYSEEDNRYYIYCIDEKYKKNDLTLSSLSDTYMRIGKNLTSQFHVYLLINANNDISLSYISACDLDRDAIMSRINNEYRFLNYAEKQFDANIFYSQLFEFINMITKNSILDTNTCVGYFIVSKIQLPGTQKNIRK